jgi:uncharacterized membrane protein YfcA
MDINVIGLIVVIAVAIGAWYVNNKFNTIPLFRNVINALIIIVGCLLIWKNLGVHQQTLHV